ncbi:MAG: hypothetical protein ACYTKD_01950 [Planctomycetota bacterium]
MVEIRHCDRCGNRLPIDLVPGKGAACPSCGHPVEDPEPVGGGVRLGPRLCLGPRPEGPPAP